MIHEMESVESAPVMADAPSEQREQGAARLNDPNLIPKIATAIDYFRLQSFAP